MLKLTKPKIFAAAVSILISGLIFIPSLVFAEECGKGAKKVKIAIPVGCKGDAGDIVNPIFDMLGGIIRFLSAGVGIVIVLMIVISGIRYITSAGNPEAIAGAKKMLTNAIIALLLFIFMAAILNFLIPGGLL